jgi:hypothetical protein
VEALEGSTFENCCAGWCWVVPVGAGCSGLFQTEQIFKYIYTGRIANDHLMKNGLGTVGILPKRLFGAPTQNNRAATL